MSKLRKTLAILLVLVMSLSLLAGCGNKSGDDKKDDGTSNENRTLNIAASGDTGTLYPLALSGGFVSLQYAFYEPLWTFTRDGTRVWKLATSYEQVGDIQYTLKLREGVTFSNGNPMTAEDVLFSMEDAQR